MPAAAATTTSPLNRKDESKHSSVLRLASKQIHLDGLKISKSVNTNSALWKVTALGLTEICIKLLEQQ